MSANLEKSPVSIGLEKVSFHSNPKKRKCKRMLKLLCNCAHFTWQQGNAQNPSSQVSAICKLRIPRCIGWVSKRQRNRRLSCQHPLDCIKKKKKGKEFQKNICFCFIDYAKAFDCVNHLFLNTQEYQTTLPLF